MPLLLDLFLSHAAIGFFTFGGGYAMLSLIEELCVEKKNWITHEDLRDITILAESTPGPVAINCATFVGYKQAGISGAVSATLGMILPSFLVIYLISMFFGQFLEITLIANAFRGIRAAVGILILNVGLRMLKKERKDGSSVCILFGSFAVMLLSNAFSLRISAIPLMLFSGALSLLLFLRKMQKKKGADRP